MVICTRCGNAYMDDELRRIQVGREVFDVCPHCLQELLDIQYEEPERTDKTLDAVLKDMRRAM